MSVKLSLFTLFVLGALLGATTAQRKLVFAHYMLWSPSSGWQPEAFVKDIQIAQSYGIDGFAINTADWRAVDWALPRSDLLYQAAQQLGTGFKLFFSLDMTNSLPNNPNDIVEMITRYHNHPNQFFVDGKHYVSTFVGNYVTFGRATSQQGWTEAFIQPLKNQGIEVCFVPFFDPALSRAPGSKQIGNPTQDDIGRVLDQFPFVSGLFNWLAWPYFYGDFQNVSSEDIQNYRQITNSRGKLYMSPVSPWFSKHMGGAPEALPNWVFGNYKGPGMWIKRWQDIIENQPDFVEIVTWNDYAERSYIVDASTAPWGAQDYDCQTFPHVAFMDLGNYFGKHYKSGQKGMPPVDQEKIYIFHRSHSKNAQAPDGLGPQDHSETHDDETYVTVLLKSPATVTITSGGQTRSFDINQTGVTTVSMPFSEGTQSAQLQRNGGTIATVTSSKAISNNIQKYDFNVYSNFAAAN